MYILATVRGNLSQMHNNINANNQSNSYTQLKKKETKIEEVKRETKRIRLTSVVVWTLVISFLCYTVFPPIALYSGLIDSNQYMELHQNFFDFLKIVTEKVPSLALN